MKFPRPSPPLVFAMRCIIALLLIAWLVRSGRLECGALRNVPNTNALVQAAVFQVLMLLFMNLRWWLLMRLQGLEVSLAWALHVGAGGQFAAVFTPAGLGLDGIRVLQGARLFPTRRGAVVAAATLDRVFGLLSLLVLCGPATLWISGISIENSMGYVDLGLLTCLLAGASMVALGQTQKLSPKILRLFISYSGVGRLPLAGAFGLSFIVHGCNIASTACGFRAMGQNITWEGGFFAAPLVILSSLIPLTPLGIGVTDGAAAELFARAAMPGGAAVTMLLRAVFVVICLGCGVALLKTVNGINGTIDNEHGDSARIDIDN